MSEAESQGKDKYVSWVVHPASVKPIRALLVIVFLAALSLLVFYLLESLFWAVFASTLLLISLRQYFLPTTFQLTDEAVVSRFLGIEKKKEWEYFKSYFTDRNGVLLSPFPSPSRLENFRGFYLMGANRRPDVLEFVKRKLNR